MQYFHPVSTAEVKLIIAIQTQPGRGADQIAAFQSLAPLVRAESGCLQYDLHHVEDDPDKFVLIERWESREALAAHDVTPHMIAADANNPTFRAGPATVLFVGPEVAAA